MLQPGRSVSSGEYRFGFNGMEQTKGVQGNSQGTFYDYKNRDYDPWKIRFNRVDPIAAQYPMLSTYQFASNSPISGVDMDGLEFYYAADGSFLGQGADPKNMEVRLATTFAIADIQTNNMTICLSEPNRTSNGYLVGNWAKVHDNHGQFREIVGTVYSEESSTFEAATGIVDVLENRAKADGNSIYDQASDNTQVFGWDHRNQINEAGVDKKRLKNATAGTIEGILVDNSEKDYSGGGYYWQGTDFEKHTAKSNAYELFYLNEGFHFTKKSHDIWGLGDNKVPGSHVIYPLIPGSTTKHQKVTATWNYKYESTGTGGKTTFMKLTEDYRLGQNNKPAKY